MEHALGAWSQLTKMPTLTPGLNMSSRRIGIPWVGPCTHRSEPQRGLPTLPQVLARPSVQLQPHGFACLLWAGVMDLWEGALQYHFA